VGEEVQREIARILHEEATDPRLRLVTLTRVDLSPDFARADVFWSTVEAKNAPSSEEAGAGLDHAAAFVRHRLAISLQLRRTPALYFHHDQTLAAGDRTLAILRELADGTKPQD
jgi:ribosome-binding factor A